MNQYLSNHGCSTHPEHPPRKQLAAQLLHMRSAAMPRQADTYSLVLTCSLQTTLGTSSVP